MGTLFPSLVYLLCFATSALCAVLLGRSFRRVKARMLFWGSICFALLALVHFIVVLDMIVFPEVELRPYRLWLTLVAVMVLLFGFIWDEDS